MKLSIVVPVFNSEKTLRKCIDSVLSQSFSDWQLILVDDGSSDSSAGICDEYSLLDSRIDVLHKSNGGVGSARNLGVSAAYGDWIFFLDSDDYLDGNNCLSVIEDSRIDSNVDLLSMGYRPIKGSNLCEPIVFDPIDEWRILQSTDYLSKYFTRGLLVRIVWAKFYKRSVLVANSLAFDESISWSEDMLFNLDFLSVASKVQILAPDSFYSYVVPTSGMAKYKVGADNVIKVQKRLLPLYISWGKADENVDRSVIWWYLSVESEFLNKLRDDSRRIDFYRDPYQEQIEHRSLSKHTLQTRVMYTLCKRFPHWSILIIKRLYFLYRKCFLG